MNDKIISEKTWYHSFQDFATLAELPDIRTRARERSNFNIPKYYDQIKLFQRGYSNADVLAKLRSERLLGSNPEIKWSHKPFSWEGGAGAVGGTGNRLDIAFGVAERNWERFCRISR